MKGMKSIPKDNTIIYDLYLDEKFLDEIVPNR